MVNCFLRKSKERVVVFSSSLFTRFDGRTLEHNSSTADKQRRQTTTGDGYLRKAAAKTTWGRERINKRLLVTCLPDILREHMKRQDTSTFFVSQRKRFDWSIKYSFPVFTFDIFHFQYYIPIINMILYTIIMTIQNPIYNYVKNIFILIGPIIIK